MAHRILSTILGRTATISIHNLRAETYLRYHHPMYRHLSAYTCNGIGTKVAYSVPLSAQAPGILLPTSPGYFRPTHLSETFYPIISGKIENMDNPNEGSIIGITATFVIIGVNSSTGWNIRRRT